MKKKARKKKAAKKAVKKRARKQVAEDSEKQNKISSRINPAAKKVLVATRARFGNELIKTLTRSGRIEKLQGFSWGPPSVNYICTGHPDVGIVRGRIYAVKGPYSSGKTTLCLGAVAQVQQAGGVAAFVDAEHALDPLHSKRIGVDTNSLLFSQPDYGEQAVEIIREFIKNKASVIFVDSVAALVPKSILEGSAEKVKIAALASLMSDALKKISGPAAKAGCAIVFTNQIRYKVGVVFGNPESDPGGEALKFYATCILDIRTGMSDKQAIHGTHSTLVGTTAKGGKIRSRVGAVSRIKCVKTKLRSPFLMTDVPLLFKGGYHNTRDLFDFSERLGLIGLARGGFKVDGKSVSFGDMEDYAPRVRELLYSVNLEDREEEFAEKMAAREGDDV